MEKLQRIHGLVENSRQPATSPSSPVPTRETAAILTQIIDLTRAGMGWNRLPEKEQNIAIIAWFEVLSDAGVSPARYRDCFRAAQQREVKRRADGKEKSIITAHDLAAEWANVQKMNREIDGINLLPANASAACTRCYGVQPHVRFCDHVFPEVTDADDLTSDDPQVRAAAQAEEARKVQDAIRNLGIAKQIDRDLQCSRCGHRDNTRNGVVERQVCRLGACMGLMLVITLPN